MLHIQAHSLNRIGLRLVPPVMFSKLESREELRTKILSNHLTFGLKVVLLGLIALTSIVLLFTSTSPSCFGRLLLWHRLQLPRS